MIRFAGTARTKQSGIEKMPNMMRKQTGRSEPIYVALTHADAAEEAQKLRHRITAEFNCAELFVTDFSLIMAYATGRGTINLSLLQIQINFYFCAIGQILVPVHSRSSFTASLDYAGGSSRNSVTP